MSEPIRVLIVDDSAVIRRLVSQALSSDPALEIVGVAANGQFALAKIPQLLPDLVTLDVDMPDMDGLETLEHLRKDHPDLPVIMFSATTRQGAASTLRALALGASDYITKPSGMGSLEESMLYVRQGLIPRIKALVDAQRRKRQPAPVRRESPQPAPPAPTSPPPTASPPTASPPVARPVAAPPSALASRPSVARPAERPAPPPVASAPVRRESAPLPPMRRALTGLPEILAIGVSTGGPNALAQVLPALPADFPLPVVIVQHMPPVFTQLLAESLDGKCALKVREATDGAVLTPGQVWIAPGDYHLVVQGTPTRPTLGLTQAPPVNFCRPAVDVLFASVAQVYGGNALGLIMTGMGQDGLKGSQQLHALGAPLLAQDEATSVVWGMPGAVTRAGLPDQVLPLDQLAPALVQLARRSARSAVSA